MARVAFIIDELFEDAELRYPYDRLREAGHEVKIIGVEEGRRLKGKRGRETIMTQLSIREAAADDFDALVIPGGYSPDRLRTNAEMVDFTREIFEAGKTTAAICHAGSMLIEADVADGRVVTSWPSIRTDLVNAGAHWIDNAVVEDANLITARKPEDLPHFSEAILRQLEGRVPPRLSPPMAPEGPRPPPSPIH
jgi:protease I